MNSTVVILALNTIPNLLDFVKGLLKYGILEIIVVNDVSANSFNHIFQDISKLEHCNVLTHKVNRGKRAGLKMPFSYFI
ncbi:MAG: glycosyltransferase family 2 protein [Clostridiales bacterium]|nr:glycosyltransferase family 2 protein [Clostridiales bacterium]